MSTPTTRERKTVAFAAPPDLTKIPQSIEAEQGVLGSILSVASMRPNEAAEALLTARAEISRAHFYNPANGTIWETMCDMSDKKQAIDFITLTQELRDRHLLDSVGGAQYVTALFSYVPTAANISYYLDILGEKYVLRQVIAAGTEAVRRAYEEQDDVPALLDELQQKVTAIAMNRPTESTLKQIGDEVEKAVQDFKNAKKHEGRTQGLATGLTDLDRCTNGLHPGEVTIVAARTSMGKTSFAMNILEHIATRRESPRKDHPDDPWVYPGYPVAIFSLETSSQSLVRRMICGKARVSLQRLRDGHLTDEQLQTIEATALKLYLRPIYIDESPALRLADFKARARYAVASLGVKVIAIDYVQLMTISGKISENAYERSNELARISAGVKATARELNISIVLVAQLNRDTDKGKGSRRPRLNNLRECGAFEQDADVVLLLYRPEYYAEEEEELSELEGEAELSIAKHRDGPTATGDRALKLTFLKEYTRFESRTEMLQSPDPEKQQEGYKKK